MIRKERRDGGREKRYREKRQKVLSQFEEEDKEHRHLPILELPRGTTLLLSSRLDSAVKRFSSEVLFSSGAAW